MHIEVFEDNPMISLLLKNDFREFASQDRFVKEGDRYFKRQLFEVDL